mgnify:CR=1 FL=1
MSLTDCVAVQLRASKSNPTGGLFLESSGSGFWGCAEEPRRIYTNAHVVHGASTLSLHVPFDSHTPYPVRLVSICPAHDLAILEMPVPAYTALLERFQKQYGPACEGPLRLDWADSKKIVQEAHANLSETSSVVAVGYPFGFRSTHQTHGSISASEIHPSKHQTYIAVSCPINPGNSGGPNIFVDKQGKHSILGINSAKISGADNEGFVIPIERVRWLKDATETDAMRQHKSNVSHFATQTQLRIEQADLFLSSIASKEHSLLLALKGETVAKEAAKCFDGCAFLGAKSFLAAFPTTLSLQVLSDEEHMKTLPTTQLINLPHFGLRYQRTTPATLLHFSQSTPKECQSGVILRNVLERTIAADAKLKTHDFLYGVQFGANAPLTKVSFFGEVDVDGRKIPLSNALHNTRIGTPLTFHVLRRNGKQCDAAPLVLLGKTRLPLREEIHEGVRKLKDALYDPYKGYPCVAVDGLVVSQLTYEMAVQFVKMGRLELSQYLEDSHRHEAALIIKTVAPGSMAALYSGIQPGMIIDRVNGTKVTRFQDFVAAAKQKSARNTWELTTSCGMMFVCQIS